MGTLFIIVSKFTILFAFKIEQLNLMKTFCLMGVELYIL